MLDRIRHLLPLSLLLPSCLSAGVRNRQQGFTVTPQKNLRRKTSKEKPQKKNLKKSLKRKGLIRKAEENEICQENLLDNHIDAE